MTLSREEHPKIAAEQRRLGLEHLAQVHDREAAKLRPRTAYTLRTTMNPLDGEQVEIEVGFNVSRGYPATWGYSGGSPEEPPEVVPVWIVRLDTGAEMEWDDLPSADQGRIEEACFTLHYQDTP